MIPGCVTTLLRYCGTALLQLVNPCQFCNYIGILVTFFILSGREVGGGLVMEAYAVQWQLKIDKRQ